MKKDTLKFLREDLLIQKQRIEISMEFRYDDLNLLKQKADKQQEEYIKKLEARTDDLEYIKKLTLMIQELEEEITKL